MRQISRKTLYRTALIAAAALGSATLASCVSHPYGYTDVSVRGGSPGYYGHRNHSYGAPYWGWQGNYYYPGVGVYVYDRDRRPHRWNHNQRRHWEGRGRDWGGDHRSRRGNWDDFHH